MTRPIYEPSLPRTDAVLGYGSDQLFRRPAPVSAYIIPGFHAYKNSNLTMVTGTNDQLRWDDWINDDVTIFEAGALSGSDLTEVKLLVEGWYSVLCWIHFSSPPTAGFAGITMIHDDTDITEPRAAAMGVTYPMNWSDNATVNFEVVRYFPPVFQTQDPPNFTWVDRLEFWAIQNHGSNRTLDNAFMEIAYLGPRDETAPSS